MKRDWAAPLLSILLGCLPAGLAGASDAEFAKALDEARCSPASVSVLRDEMELKSYEVTCLGKPPTKIGISCTKRACTVSHAAENGDFPPPPR